MPQSYNACFVFSFDATLKKANDFFSLFPRNVTYKYCFTLYLQCEATPQSQNVHKLPQKRMSLLTNYRSLAHSEASNQQQRGYSGPCGHCALCGKFGKHDANMVPKVIALHSKGKLFPCRQVLTCANYGIYVATCKLCGEQYVGQTSNKFSKRWNSHRSSWDTVNLSNDQEQVPFLHHVVHEHMIEKSLKSVNVL